MSGRGKKSGRRNHSRSVGDVTINDFANATVCKNRTKKSLNNVASAIKSIEVDDRSWDEKASDFDDFDFVEQENDDGTKSVVIKPRRRRKTMTELDIIEDREGVDYPLDIWFLISEYIRPEDVGRFAGICRSTYEVVCSAKFWFGMYKRYYKNVPNLPERLQPECMVRLYGLKACVIRALYYFYTPFVNRTKAVITFEEHPYNLVKRQCTLMWHLKYKNCWLYNFKLREISHLTLNRDKDNPSNKKPDLIEMLEDVMANNEDGCRILQVCCPHFVPIPLVMGFHLSSVSLTLSQGFRQHRLQLGFGSALHNSGCTEIILDPVINVKVLDWWNPLYPHSQTKPYTENQE